MIELIVIRLIWGVPANKVLLYRAVRSYVDSMVETDSYFGVRARAMFIGRLDGAWDKRLGGAML